MRDQRLYLMNDTRIITDVSMLSRRSQIPVRNWIFRPAQPFGCCEVNTSLSNAKQGEVEIRAGSRTVRKVISAHATSGLRKIASWEVIKGNRSAYLPRCEGTRT